MSKKQRISERIEWEIVSNTMAWVDLDGECPVALAIWRWCFLNFFWLVFSLKKINSFIWQHQVLAVACTLLAVACRIYFPDQESNPDSLHWEWGISATGPLGNSLEVMFLKVVWIEWSGQKSGGSGWRSEDPNYWGYFQDAWLRGQGSVKRDFLLKR